MAEFPFALSSLTPQKCIPTRRKHTIHLRKVGIFRPSYVTVIRIICIGRTKKTCNGQRCAPDLHNNLHLVNLAPGFVLWENFFKTTDSCNQHCESLAELACVLSDVLITQETN